jgi:predicted N-acetyltransferase YhbS
VTVIRLVALDGAASVGHVMLSHARVEEPAYDTGIRGALEYAEAFGAH